ncbi:MAG TPA: aldo/keto reductase [Longimicrobiales bacterium]|nr:aldo/keto reductase [Longimicrobiales bacterium]
MSLTRRGLLKLGAAAGLWAAAGRPWPLLAQELRLRRVTIPSSGERLPQVGIGCRGYRGEPDSPEMAELRATLETFHRLGGRVLDTSPAYGNSEEVVGRLLRELGIREELFVATEVDRAGREEGVRRMERSFELLGGEPLDLVRVHVLDGVETHLPMLRAWKERGRLRLVGVTATGARQYEQVERVLRRHRLDFIQVDYSLGERSAAERLISLAADRGVAVLASQPFGRGRMFTLVGDLPLPPWAAEIGARSWAQLFLKYVMAAPGVVIPIPGTTQARHVEDNLRAAVGPLPDARLRREMERFIDPLL